MDRRGFSSRFHSESLFARIFPPDRDSRVAILYDHREITYGELCDEAIRVVEVLNGVNVKSGDRVAILLADSPDFIASFVAVISLGAIAVPINLALRRPEQVFILNDCGARAAIVEARAAADLFRNEGASVRAVEFEHLLIVNRNGDDMRGLTAEHGQQFGDARRRRLAQDFPVRDSED